MTVSHQSDLHHSSHVHRIFCTGRAPQQYFMLWQGLDGSTPAAPAWPTKRTVAARMATAKSFDSSTRCPRLTCGTAWP